MNLRELSTTFDHIMKQLEIAGQQLLTNGIVLFEDPDAGWPSTDTHYADKAWSEARQRYLKMMPPLGNVFVRRIIKKVAKELKRPVIVAEKDYWADRDGRTNVTVRKSKGRAVLVAQFLLFLGTEFKPKQPVWIKQDKTNWYLQFYGKRGEKLFKEWQEHIKTDPACRKALKLDTHP